jgi:hypothetical protein
MRRIAGAKAFHDAQERIMTSILGMHRTCKFSELNRVAPMAFDQRHVEVAHMRSIPRVVAAYPWRVRTISKKRTLEERGQYDDIIEYQSLLACLPASPSAVAMPFTFNSRNVNTGTTMEQRRKIDGRSVAWTNAARGRKSSTELAQADCLIDLGQRI